VTPEAETTDRLLGGRVEIRQPGAGFRVSTDAVLLAAAVALDGGNGRLMSAVARVVRRYVSLRAWRRPRCSGSTGMRR